MKQYQHDTLPYRRRLPLRLWQRLILAAVLLVTLTLSSALIYFQPGTRTLVYRATERPAPMVETMPALPPGTDLYYYWGQWKPLGQQP